MCRLFELIIFGVLAYVLAGCSLSPVKSPSMNQYTIEPERIAKNHQAPATGIVLMVAQPKANPGYKGQSMLYKTRSHELAAYQQNQWTSAPVVMLQSVLASHIQQHNYFKYVAQSPYVGNYDYRLQTQLLRLYQTFRQQPSQIRLTLSVQIIDNTTDHVIASRTYDTSQKATDNDPYSGVLAANQAANEIARQVADFAIKTVKQAQQQGKQ